MDFLSMFIYPLENRGWFVFLSVVAPGDPNLNFGPLSFPWGERNMRCPFVFLHSNEETRP